MKKLLIIVAICFFAAPVLAQRDKEECGNFFSCAISDVFNKVGEYTSGEKDILIPEDKWADEEPIEYGVDSTGRRVPKATAKSGKSLSQ